VVAPYLWAQALGLPQSETKGARRIRDALKWLEGTRLIKVKRVKEHNPRIYLMSQGATGGAYKRPRPRGEIYASLPVAFWANGWILEMSAAAIAVLLILLQLQYGSEGEPIWIRSAWQYDLSGDTWTRGTGELVGMGFLVKKREVRGDELLWRRRRNLYWIRPERFDELPGTSNGL
jgi:hypothetical protein